MPSRGLGGLSRPAPTNHRLTVRGRYCSGARNPLARTSCALAQRAEPCRSGVLSRSHQRAKLIAPAASPAATSSGNAASRAHNSHSGWSRSASCHRVHHTIHSHGGVGPPRSRPPPPRRAPAGPRLVATRALHAPRRGTRGVGLTPLCDFDGRPLLTRPPGPARRPLLAPDLLLPHPRAAPEPLAPRAPVAAPSPSPAPYPIFLL